MTHNTDSYDFQVPNLISFGWGRLAEAGRLAKPWGNRAVVFCGSKTLKSNGVLDSLLKSLEESKIGVALTIDVHGEPSVEQIDKATAEVVSILNSSKTSVIAIGGGSAIDTAKAIAAMAVNAKGTSVRDFLEGVGTGAAIKKEPLPIIAIPTTAGTGAEATKNAVISVSDPFVKKSLRHKSMMPKVALVDPELTTSCSPAVTAASGIDALTQLIESFISRKAKPIPQALAIEGLGLIWNSLEVAYKEPQNRDAREKVSHAALLSGMCLANSGLGMAHGVAAALGAEHRVAHGIACGCMLPIALKVNKQESMAELSALANFLLPPSGNYGEDRVDEFIERVEQICQTLKIPTRLSQLGVHLAQIPALARGSLGNSMNGNPKELSVTEIIEILEKTF